MDDRVDSGNGAVSIAHCDQAPAASPMRERFPSEFVIVATSHLLVPMVAAA